MLLLLSFAERTTSISGCRGSSCKDGRCARCDGRFDWFHAPGDSASSSCATSASSSLSISMLGTSFKVGASGCHIHSFALGLPVIQRSEQGADIIGVSVKEA